jgi:hypothetical protein
MFDWGVRFTRRIYNYYFSLSTIFVVLFGFMLFYCSRLSENHDSSAYLTTHLNPCCRHSPAFSFVMTGSVTGIQYE